MQFKQIARQLRGYANINNAVIVVAAVISAAWMWSTIEAIQKNFELQQKVDNLSQEIAVQDLQNRSRSLQNKYYQSNEYLELSARERLNKVSPGEKVIILPPNKVKAQQENANPAASDQPANQSNFSQWMYFLLGQKG
jgi:cell division protein FtsB